MSPTSEFPDPPASLSPDFSASPLDSPQLQEIYSRTAAFYDQVVAEHQAAAKLVALDLLNRQHGERFLEVAVGTGWAFERLIAASGPDAAYGLEIAPGMIDVARQRLGNHATLLLGDSTRLPFRDGTFDCLLCTYTLECMAEPAITATLAEIRRVVAHDGRIVVADLTDGEGTDAAMTNEWKAGFERDPAFYGGARPIRLGPFLAEAGLKVLERRYLGGTTGWPSEVVLGRRLSQ